MERESLQGLAGIRARSASAKRQATGQLRSRAESIRSDFDEVIACQLKARAENGPDFGSVMNMDPDMQGSHSGLKTAMTNWIDGGESDIHSICETLRSCVEAGELLENTPLCIEIEACMAERPSLSLAGMNKLLNSTQLA